MPMEWGGAGASEERKTEGREEETRGRGTLV